MATGINKVILIGNVGKDPELRYTQGGSPVCNFSIATNEAWVDGEGKKQERTEWHNIVVWGKQAESVSKYLSKGRQAYIEGRLQTRTWEKDGQKHYTTEINAARVIFLGGPSGEPRGDKQEQHDPDPAPGTGTQGTDAGAECGAPVTDDDIPF